MIAVVAATMVVSLGFQTYHNIRRNALRNTMSGPGGPWDAVEFYELGLGLSIYDDSQPGLTLTREASIYAVGCIGLVTLRLGHRPYDANNFYYTDLDDAVTRATVIGSDARIFAIQAPPFETDPNSGPYVPMDDGLHLRSRVRMIRPQDDGNHATWHQPYEGQPGFWEYLGETGWANNLAFENWVTLASQRYVVHRPELKPKAWTVYGVADLRLRAPFVPQTVAPPPLEGTLDPTPAPSL
jgi:hypothetical protein